MLRYIIGRLKACNFWRFWKASILTENYSQTILNKGGEMKPKMAMPSYSKGAESYGARACPYMIDLQKESPKAL
jgi:hypothetical protein